MWGVLGLGAFGFQLQEVPDNQRIVTTTRSHSNKLVTDCVQAMEPHKVIKVGGAGNKVGGANISVSNLPSPSSDFPFSLLILRKLLMVQNEDKHLHVCFVFPNRLSS